MITRYKYGFRYKEKLYGWKNKRLYRLPQMIGKRYYSLLECAVWMRKGNPYGHYLGSDRKSDRQLKSMTCFINHEVDEVESDDMPF